MERETQWPSGGGLWFSVFYQSSTQAGNTLTHISLIYLHACTIHVHTPLPPLHPQPQMHTQPDNNYKVFLIFKG